MSEYQLKLTLIGVGSRGAQVRAWIDTELGGDLDCEQQINLVRADEASWMGLFSAEGESFMYRVGICAPPGTEWALSLRDGHDNDHELLFDADMLTMAKEWLIGSWEPPGSNGDAEPDGELS